MIDEKTIGELVFKEKANRGKIFGGFPKNIKISEIRDAESLKVEGYINFGIDNPHFIKNILK